MPTGHKFMLTLLNYFAVFYARYVCFEGTLLYFFFNIVYILYQQIYTRTMIFVMLL
jgi:hypothetical protein